MNLEINGIFGLIIVFLDIWAIVKIIQSNSTNLKKAIWILLILILPILGLILWFIFGNKESESKF